MMMEGNGSPVSSVAVGMVRASGTAVGRHSAGASGGVAGLASAARLVASLSG